MDSSIYNQKSMDKPSANGVKNRKGSSNSNSIVPAEEKSTKDFMEEVKTEQSPVGQSITTAQDVILLTVMTFWGTCSGKIAPVRDSLKPIVTIYHLMSIMLMMTGMILLCATGWDSNDTFGPSLLVKVLYHCWHLECIFNVILMFRCGHSSSAGLFNYYKQVDKVTAELDALGAKPCKRSKKISYVIGIVTAIAAAYNFAWIIQETVRGSPSDPFIGPQINIRNPTNSSRLAITIFGTYMNFYCSGAFIFLPAYFAAIALKIAALLSRYNEHLDYMVQEEPQTFRLNLYRYRKLHLSLTGVLGRADDSLRLAVANHMAMGVVVLLTILYVLAKLSSLMEDGTGGILFVIGCVYWLLAAVAILAVEIFASNKVFSKITECFNGVMEIADYDDVTGEENFQLQLFLAKLATPETFTAGGLLIVEKDLAITLVSFIGTYFIVMLQFQAE